MVLNVPLQLVEEMKPVSRETCLNFVYFRTALKSHRTKCDDKISQRLSSITNCKDQCPKFAENLQKAQESRIKNLKFCISVLAEANFKFLEDTKSIITGESHAFKKEKGLLESEIIVEEIICEQMLYCPVEECDQDLPFSTTKQFLEHLENSHELKIHEPAAVTPFIDQYLNNYKEVLQEAGHKVLGGNEALFPDDLMIRQTLNSKMLNGLLQTQQIERNTIYKRTRMCLFCSETCSNLHELFAHMFKDHHFNIGLLDNLIFIETFLYELEEMTKFKKQCLFCMEKFRNGTCLRKHMKSKNHFKINGKDERWDQFYLINYVNLNKSNNASNNDSVSFKNEPEPLDEEDNNWDDLDDEIDLQTQCLFCDKILSNPEDCFIHMQNLHSFNIKNIQREHNLKFYDTMKLINYFRNCQREDTEAFEECKEEENHDLVLKNKFEKNQIPSPKLWNRPEFYFPVYEEDPLLTAIESDNEEELENSE